MKLSALFVVGFWWLYPPCLLSAAVISRRATPTTPRARRRPRPRPHHAQNVKNGHYGSCLPDNTAFEALMANMMRTIEAHSPTLVSMPPPPQQNATYLPSKVIDANGREIEVYSSKNPNTPDGFPTGTDWRRQADLAGVDRYVQNLQGTSGKSDTQTQGASYLIAGSPSTIATGGVKTPSVRGNFTELLATADRGSVYPGEDSAHGSTAMRANKFVAQPKPAARKGSDPLASLIERESADFIQGRTRR